MSITIILDNYENACYPGQTLSGRAQCDFHQEEKLRAIRIHFKGSAKTKWSESRGSGKNKRTVHFYAEEDYFNAEYNLLDGPDEITLPAGRHIYPFSYILPPQLPSACDLAYGHVHYKIKATVDRPWKFDYESEFYLNVISPLDLNYIPGLREARATTADKEVGCCCFRSGPVKLDVSLPVTGFVPGQEINIGCYVENMSNVSISEVKFKITAIFEFIAHHPHTKSRHSEDTVVKHVDGGIGAHGEKSWTSNFVIPPSKYVNLISCGIINFSYILEVTAVLPCPHTNLSTSVPVMIGSIPLSGVNTALPGPPIMEQPLPQYPVGYQGPPVLNPSAPVMPQPNAPYPYEGAAAPSFATNINDLPTYNEVSKDKM